MLYVWDSVASGKQTSEDYFMVHIFLVTCVIDQEPYEEPASALQTLPVADVAEQISFCCLMIAATFDSPIAYIISILQT